MTLYLYEFTAQQQELKLRMQLHIFWWIIWFILWKMSFLGNEMDFKIFKIYFRLKKLDVYRN